MSSKKGLDYDILSDPSDPSFIHELKHATRILGTKSAPKFYSAVVQHFSGEIDEKIGNEILLTLAMLMQSRSLAQAFTSEKCILKLPFDKECFRKQLLDLLFYLVKNDANSLIPEVAPQFAIVLEKAPAKCLTILAILAQKFDRIQDPWPIFQLVVKQPQIFATDDLIGNYVSLLVYMNKNYEQFRKAYSKRSWISLCSMLSNESDELVKMSICGLCAIYDINPKAAQRGKFPIKDFTVHLKKPDMKSATLPLLLRIQPKDADPEDLKPLIKNLLKLAHSEKKATLILMDMAMEENTAKILVENPKWIKEQLPTTVETIRLFAVVLSHKGLRPKIMETDAVISLFRNMIEEGDPIICSIMCTFVRRLPLTKDFVLNMGRHGIIKDYIELFLKTTDNNVIMSGLLFIDAISAQVYHKDYVYFINNLLPLLKDPNTMEPAAAVAANLAKHSKSHRAFRENRLVKFFQNALKETNIKKSAKKFLRNLENYKESE